MELTKYFLKDFAVIKVDGNLGDDNSYKTKLFVENIIDDGQLKILLNLEKMGHVTSLGIGVIVALWKRAGQKGGALFVLANQLFRAEMASLNLDGIIRMFSSLEEFSTALELGVGDPLAAKTYDKGEYRVFEIKAREKTFLDTDQLMRELQKALATGAKKIALDLSNLDYLYSQLIGAFVSMAAETKKKDGELCLFAMTPDIMRSIQASGIGPGVRVLPPEESLPST